MHTVIKEGKSALMTALILKQTNQPIIQTNYANRTISAVMHKYQNIKKVSLTPL